MRWMMLAAAVPLASCGMADGVEAAGGATRSYDLSGFSAVDLRGSDDVDVRVGPAFSVRAEGDAAVLDKLRIEVRDGTLRIARRQGIDLGDHGEARVHVTMPAITAARIAGSGAMTVDRIAGEAMSASVAGSGDLSLGALRVRDVRFSIAGSGDIAARGEAERMQAQVAGSGSLEARGLTVRAAEVTVAGSGDVRAMVKGAARVSGAGSGDVELGPDARCTGRLLGSGKIRCGG